MDANIENDTESFTARKSAIDFLETISKHVDENDGKGGGNKKGNRKKRKVNRLLKHRHAKLF